MTTFGPPPWSGVNTNSARPSRYRSPAATNAPPVKLLPNGSVGGTSTVVWSAPLMTANRTGVPGPVTRMKSGIASPLTSAAAPRRFTAGPPNGLSGLPDAESMPAASGVNTWAVPSGCPVTTTGRPLTTGGAGSLSMIVTVDAAGLPSTTPPVGDVSARMIDSFPSNTASSLIVIAKFAVVWPSANVTVTGSPV